MLSIGMPKATLIRVFVYEATILVIINALFGFGIGTFVGNLIIYLFCINVAYPFFPQLALYELRTVLILSLFFALASTYGSVRKQVSRIIHDRI